MDKYEVIYDHFVDYTMIPKHTYINNLKLIEQFKGIEGDIVECGVWKGGMMAGIASLFHFTLNQKQRFYSLFDSFEGLPKVDLIDGLNAKQWQENITDPGYHDNCSADISFAKQVMSISGVDRVFYSINKGWYKDTLPGFNQDIAILRLDSDWYQPTMECLENLYDKVVPGGVIILDDYYVWEGCSKAVHKFLSNIESKDRIKQFDLFQH